MGVKNVIVSSKKYTGFKDMVKKKKRFPSTRARFCTEELKTIPMIDYILDQTEHLIIIQGIRADESDSRSKMSKQCSYFKYYYTPYGKDKKGKDKYHKYRKKEVLAWREKYLDDIIRPCFEWTAQETIDYIVQHDQKPNPLYYMGMGRVGCFPCVMCRLSEIKQIADRFPERIKEISEIEKEVGSTIFTVGKIPEKFCSKIHVSKKTGKVSKYPTIDDVVNYVQKEKDQLDAFIEPGAGHGCMSVYGMCE